jgi:hypothetical protein
MASDSSKALLSFSDSASPARVIISSRSLEYLARVAREAEMRVRSLSRASAFSRSFHRPWSSARIFNSSSLAWALGASKIPPQKIYLLLDLFDFTVCFRFHSYLSSSLTGFDTFSLWI